MADNSGIEWTDTTWNPITGCSVVSPGCTNCYAMGLAGTRLRNHPSRAGLTREVNGHHVWTGEVRLNEQWLDQPLRWTRSRRIFVCAHGDLFHGSVPDAWLDRVFAVMALAPQHTFQVLTKRPDVMLDYIQRRTRDWRAVLSTANPHGSLYHCSTDRAQRALGALPPLPNDPPPPPWPLPNVWLGVSVEDQRRADERIPDLLATPAAVRFLSCEPLLGPLAGTTKVTVAGETTVTNWLTGTWQTFAGDHYRCGHLLGRAKLDWVIAGGESGPKARRSHPDWFRSLRDQCQAAGVPFFFKQWGEWAPVPEGSDEARAAFPHNGWQMLRGHEGPIAHAEELYPEGGAVFVARVGKTRAGALLDGREWREMPR